MLIALPYIGRHSTIPAANTSTQLPTIALSLTSLHHRNTVILYSILWGLEVFNWG